MPFRLESDSPKPAQASRRPSGDHWRQPVKRAGSDIWSCRNFPLSGSTIVTAQLPWPSVQGARMATSLPSGDQWGSSEGAAENSCSMWLPSGFAV